MPKRPPSFKHPAYRGEAGRKKDFDKQRPSSSRRGYGSKWQKARQAFLFKHPLCRICEEKGIIQSANVVDHIIPHKGDMKLFWSRSNWQPLCTTCHNRKTAVEDSKFTSPRE